MRSIVARISVTASPVTGSAVAEIAHQRFGGMRERFQPRQREKAAGPFDGMDEAEDVIEDLGVVRILLEANQLHVDDIEAFARLGKKFPQQFVHGTGTFDATRDPPDRLPRGNQIGTSTSLSSVLVNGLILVAPPQRAAALIRR